MRSHHLDRLCQPLLLPRSVRCLLHLFPSSWMLFPCTLPVMAPVSLTFRHCPYPRYRGTYRHWRRPSVLEGQARPHAQLNSSLKCVGQLSNSLPVSWLAFMLHIPTPSLATSGYADQVTPVYGPTGYPYSRVFDGHWSHLSLVSTHRRDLLLLPLYYGPLTLPLTSPRCFLQWMIISLGETEFTSFVIIHPLQGMLDSTIMQPVSNVLIAPGAQQPNPVYSYWLHADQLIYAWIFAMISKDTLCEACNISHTLPTYHHLASHFNTANLAWALDLKCMLTNESKSVVGRLSVLY